MPDDPKPYAPPDPFGPMYANSVSLLEDHCPVCGDALLYWPAGDEHACRNPECRWREKDDSQIG